MPTSADLQRLYGIVSEVEQKTGRELSDAARQLLILPIGEILDHTSQVDWGAVFSSILKIVQSAEVDEYSGDLGGGDTYNARTMIAAFYRNFCNIPPFCGPVVSKRAK